MAAIPPSNHDTRPTNADADWIYRMEVSHALPLINLDKTPIASMLSADNHDKFLALMRKHYARFSSLYRVSGVLLLVTLVVPRTVGYWLSVPTLLMAIPSLSCAVVMNSSDILKILPRQDEFWFFTVMNAINWGCLASFYSDFRILSLFGGVVGTQWVVLIDSNFRTVTSSIRSTSVAAPVLLRNYRVIPVANIKVTLVDVFLNTSITLAVFVARKGYAKRKVLITHSAILQTIRAWRVPSCRPDRVIVCATGNVATHERDGRDAFHSNEDSKDATTATAPATTAMAPGAPVPANEPTEQPQDHQQQVSLVSMQLGAVDIRHVVVPRLSPLSKPLSTVKTFLFHANAVIGFTTTVYTLTRRPAGSKSPPTSSDYALAITALVTTLVFFLTCLASFHRQLTNSLLHNFDFLLSSVQFTFAMFLISDMVQWDFRTLGAMAWLLWFHCVLFLDALTPPIKRHLRFRKVFLLPVIVSSLVGIIFIIYGFFFSDVADYFQDRTLWETRFRGKVIGLRTKSLLLNRLFTVLLWSFRLIWEVAGCPKLRRALPVRRQAIGVSPGPDRS